MTIEDEGGEGVVGVGRATPVVGRLLIASGWVMAGTAAVGLVVFLLRLGAVLDDVHSARFIFHFVIGFVTVIVTSVADLSSARSVRDAAGRAVAFQIIALSATVITGSYLIAWLEGQAALRWVRIGAGTLVALRIGIALLVFLSPVARRRGANVAPAHTFRPIHLLVIVLNGLVVALAALQWIDGVIGPVQLALFVAWVASIPVIWRQRSRRAWLGLVFPSLYLLGLAVFLIAVWGSFR